MKKLYLVIALAVALVVSGSVFAFTSTTATAAISATATKSDFATVEIASTMPDFGNVLGKQRGSLPAGNVFIITSHADYTGDLLVRVYLTNSGALTLAYQHLNMKLKLINSVEAGDPGHQYQVITLNNAEVTFNLQGQAGTACNLILEGGSYATNPYDPLAWQKGYSVNPALYCEVTQR